MIANPIKTSSRISKYVFFITIGFRVYHIGNL
jgi:hypothetical protein